MELPPIFYDCGIFCTIDKKDPSQYRPLSNNESAEVARRSNSHKKLVKHVEALKSVCETYIPTDRMDEANDEVILLCVGNVEEMGRKLMSEQTPKEAEQQ